jgi:hypothetical protein
MVNSGMFPPFRRPLLICAGDPAMNKPRLGAPVKRRGAQFAAAMFANSSNTLFASMLRAPKYEEVMLAIFD